ncbi:AMP-binding protein [Micromonospora chersina]|uniref:AMP-binding protein n=1 Tax=Micromonospora chersina TaxID=47854 RepID=UPI00371B3AB7
MTTAAHPLADRLREAMARHRNRPAIGDGRRTLSYGELLDEVDAARTALVLAPYEPVGLHVAQDLSTRILYLAVLLGGGVVVPLSHTWPVDRQHYVLDSLNITRLLAAGQPARCPAGWSPVRRVQEHQEFRALGAAGEAKALHSPVAGDPMAYVLHTSGSTGTPKGVPVRQSAVLTFLDYVVARYGIDPTARLSATFELSFDLAVFDLLAPLLAGASVHLPIGREYLVPGEYATRAGLTHWFSVPSVISTAVAMDALAPGSLPSLRWSLFCGEPLMLSQAAQWREAAPGSVLENLYGPTELTLACTQYRLPDDPRRWPTTVNGSVPIGSIYPHLDFRVGSARDDAELLVDGPQRFDGYVDPTHDDTAFETDCDGRRWYRTGDRVDVQAGQLVHRGRLDRQTKVGGMRIELDEVEGAFRKAPGVTGAAAVVIGEPGLRSIVVALTGDADRADEVTRRVADLLPEYMRPEDVRWLPAFPLNGNRKVDHLALARLLDLDRAS